MLFLRSGFVCSHSGFVCYVIGVMVGGGGVGMRRYALQCVRVDTKNHMVLDKISAKSCFWYAGIRISPGAYVLICAGMWRYAFLYPYLRTKI